MGVLPRSLDGCHCGSFPGTGGTNNGIEPSAAGEDSFRCDVLVWSKWVVIAVPVCGELRAGLSRKHDWPADVEPCVHDELFIGQRAGVGVETGTGEVEDGIARKGEV